MTEKNLSSRRGFLKGSLAATAASPIAALGHTMSSLAMTSLESPFFSILRLPDLVRAFGPDGEIKLNHIPAQETWSGSGVEISFHLTGTELTTSLTSQGKVSRVQLRWHGNLRAATHFLGDHWERSYADLEWRGEAAGRTMPWYFLASDGKRTHGYGVKTGAGALCFWNADSQGISLWLDVRSGGVPVELGDRKLLMAEILEVSSPGSAFQTAQILCQKMCPNPRLPSEPIYGTNDWNYAYGNSSAELIASVSGLISELSPNTEHRPYSLIDEGWAMGPYNNKFGYGPWVGNPRFGDMGEFAHRLKGLGVKPGLWFRPLTPVSDALPSCRLERNKEYLDPTCPGTQEHIISTVSRFKEWGYEMIKHDFTTWDVMGKWGATMGPMPTEDGWKLQDRSKTNAEVFTDLYQLIRKAAGDMRLIGCNTIGHLSAGTHEIQRIGDDTSGRSWNRNRRMGVNTLAFRAPQHRHFFIADPDIVSITKNVPWSLVSQWLQLVSESGAALFVAIEPSIVTPEHRKALKTALDLAARQLPTGEPLDWMTTECPREWMLNGKRRSFAWMNDEGAWPFGD